MAAPARVMLPRLAVRASGPAGRAAPMSRPGRGEIAVVVSLTALAATVRFATLGRQSLWYDEAVTVGRVLRHSLGATLAEVRGGESTPPLYYVLAWLWTRAFGLSANGIRSLSALAGTLTVPAAWMIGRRLRRPAAGLALAALVAANPLLVWYSQEARAYALFVLLGGLSFAAFLNARSGRPRALAAWGALSLLALAAHYFAVFLIVPEAAWLALAARDRARALAAIALTALLAAPLAALAVAQHDATRLAWIARYPLADRLGAVAVSPFVGGPDAPLYRAGAIGAILVAAALAVAARRSAVDALGPALPGVTVGVAALIAPVAVALSGLDVVTPRNVIGAWLPLGSAAAVVLTAPGARRAGAAATAVLCVAGLAAVAWVDSSPRLARPDWRGAAAALSPQHGARAVVAPFLGAAPLQLYVRGARRTGARERVTVSEIDVIGWPARDGPPLRSPPGFHVAASMADGPLLALRLRATRPRALTVGQLLRARMRAGPTVVLVQGRAAGRRGRRAAGATP
jgi:hypothetical protein